MTSSSLLHNTQVSQNHHKQKQYRKDRVRSSSFLRTNRGVGGCRRCWHSSKKLERGEKPCPQSVVRSILSPFSSRMGFVLEDGDLASLLDNGVPVLESSMIGVLWGNGDLREEDKDGTREATPGDVITEAPLAILVSSCNAATASLPASPALLLLSPSLSLSL